MPELTSIRTVPADWDGWGTLGGPGWWARCAAGSANVTSGADHGADWRTFLAGDAGIVAHHYGPRRGAWSVAAEGAVPATALAVMFSTSTY
jgi:hypothetical protein